MSVPPHIEEFQKIAALILGQLYEAFPVAIDIDRDAIARAVVGSESFADVTLPSGRRATELDATLPSGRRIADLISHTMVWLNAEGFTRKAGGSVRPWNSVRLSGKGLAALNAIPPGFEGSLGQKLSTVAKEEKRDWSGLGDLIGGMFGGFTKSISS